MNQKLWWSWTLNCTLGELLGIGIAGSIAVVANTLIGEPHSLYEKLSVLILMLLAGLIEGSLLAYFQWKVLVKKFTNLAFRQWYYYTVLVAVLGWFLGMMPSLFFPEHGATNDTV